MFIVSFHYKSTHPRFRERERERTETQFDLCTLGNKIRKINHPYAIHVPRSVASKTANVKIVEPFCVREYVLGGNVCVCASAVLNVLFSIYLITSVALNA